MSGAAAILVVIVVFGLLIVVHELGHFAIARAFGMRVERFSVGFGPVILRRTRGATEWAISAIPFGGYVRIAGMAPGDDVAPGDRGAYANQAAWRRFLVILAGPAMNAVTAVALAAALLATVGFLQPDPRAAVGEVVAGGAAERAGLRAGDRVVAVDGRPIETWPELVAAVVASPGRPLALEVERPDAGRLRLAATPDDAGGRGRLGVGPALRAVRAPGAGALPEAVRLTAARAADTVAGLGQAFRREQRAELRGPLGIVQEMVRSARAGPGPFLQIVWFISIVLAVFNLLPVPALDGGRLVFLAYEIVARRRVNQRVESIVHLAGFVALFGLILAVTVFGDLARLFRR
jgi:regulator of sigma E protease